MPLLHSGGLMPTDISTIETLARRYLLETTASFWTSAELVDITNAGIKDLWRAVADLKQEHYLTIDATNVTLPANTSELLGVPADVHKVYLIEPRDLTTTGSHRKLIFTPLDYNHDRFAAARSVSAFDPSSGGEIYYAITQQGSPVGAPIITCAPQVNAVTNLMFAYVPTLDPLVSGGAVPIPGEADNALVAWTVAFARAKEREDRSPDPSWLAVYATEKAHLLESLGLRQLQEPKIVDGLFDDYWS